MKTLCALSTLALALSGVASPLHAVENLAKNGKKSTPGVVPVASGHRGPQAVPKVAAKPPVQARPTPTGMCVNHPGMKVTQPPAIPMVNTMAQRPQPRIQNPGVLGTGQDMCRPRTPGAPFVNGSPRGPEHNLTNGHSNGWGQTLANGQLRGVEHPVVNAQPNGWGHPLTNGQPRGWEHDLTNGHPGGWGHSLANGQPRSLEHPLASAYQNGWGRSPTNGQPHGWERSIPGGRQGNWDGYTPGGQAPVSAGGQPVSASGSGMASPSIAPPAQVVSGGNSRSSGPASSAASGPTWQSVGNAFTGALANDGAKALADGASGLVKDLFKGGSPAGDSTGSTAGGGDSSGGIWDSIVSGGESLIGDIGSIFDL